jgi:hypothetical protein
VSRRKWRSVTLGAAGLALVAASAARTAPAHQAIAARCDGSERWAIKTLADRDAREIKAKVKKRTVRQLLGRRRPPGFTEKIRNPGVETTVFEVEASVIEARWVNQPRSRDRRTGKIRKGGDLDIHLVIAPADDPNDLEHTMVVEMPFPRCIADTARWRNRMVDAREAFLAACGKPSGTFHSLLGVATIRGVGFFDRPHARGAAKNGIELHPLIGFASTDCHQA